MEAVIRVILVVSSLTLALVQTAPRQPRFSLAEYAPAYYHNSIDGIPGTYSFGYDVSDPATDNTQYRSEDRYSNGTVMGSYGYIDPNGTPQRFRYIADHYGYRVFPDYTTARPFVMPHSGNEPTESTVTWTRPPKPSNKKSIKELVSQLGTIFKQTQWP